MSVDEEIADDVLVDDDGNWSLPLTTPLDDGDHTVTATQTDPAGNESVADEVSFTVDTGVPNAPTITAPPNNAIINDTTPTIAGTGEAGALLTLELNGVEIADDVLVDTEGNWSLTLTDPLEDAVYTVTATQTDEAGTRPRRRPPSSPWRPACPMRR